jgi:hypothetical protein
MGTHPMIAQILMRSEEGQKCDNDRKYASCHDDAVDAATGDKTNISFYNSTKGG